MPLETLYTIPIATQINFLVTNNLKAIITNQKHQFVQMKQAITKLEKTLSRQQHLLNQQTIPNKYPPKERLLCYDETVDSTFLNDYKNLFLHHLQKVVQANMILLEIKKANSQSILNTVEAALADSNEPLQTIRQMYYEFCSGVQLWSLKTNPHLKTRKLRETIQTPTQKKTSMSFSTEPITIDTPPIIIRKRKLLGDHPRSKKSAKQDNLHLLVPGHSNNCDPP